MITGGSPTGSARSAQDFAAEQPFLAPLPAEPFDPGLVLTPRVDRSSLITVRMVKYSVPARFIGRNVRVSLRASEVVVFDGRTVIARSSAHRRPERAVGPTGSLPGSAQDQTRGPARFDRAGRVRDSGAFTIAHEAFWAASRRVNGDAERHPRTHRCPVAAPRPWTPRDVRRGSPRHCRWGRSARTSSLSRPAVMPPQRAGAGFGPPYSLLTRRGRATGCQLDPAPAHGRSGSRDRRAPADTRPLPTVRAYDELLATAPHHSDDPPTTPSKEKSTCHEPCRHHDDPDPAPRRGLTEQPPSPPSTRPAADCACRRSGRCWTKHCPRPTANNSPTKASWPSCCWPNADQLRSRVPGRSRRDGLAGPAKSLAG